MKKFISLVIASIISLVAIAQDEHLTFKKIPISGHKDTFIKQLKQEGFELLKDENNKVVMSGSFAGFDNCGILFGYSKKSNTVYSIMVNLPSKQDWIEIKQQYNELKSQYLTKYGEPEDSWEEFYPPYKEGNGSELKAISEDKGTYKTYWNTDNGMIYLGIEAAGEKDGWVGIAYQDYKSSDIMKKEKEPAVHEDI